MPAKFWLSLFLLVIAPAAFAQSLDEIVAKTAAQEPAVETEKTTPVTQNETVEKIPVAPPPIASAEAPQTAKFEAKKFAIVQTLDKVTARTATVTLPVGQAQAVGPLFVDIKTCQKTPPSEQPEAVAFVQVWEAKPQSKIKHAKSAKKEMASQWVFSGWMYGSSPALSAMDHPIYDVWLKDCTDQ